MNDPSGTPTAAPYAPATSTRLAPMSAFQAWYGVGILGCGLMFASIDRYILSLLVEPVKRDLAISDTQMSLLMGFAFVSLYAVAGLPISRLADRMSRRLITGLAIAFWSLMTALSGLAQGFSHIFIARMGVGVGEAAYSPAMYSMVTDSFPKEKLPQAMAVLSLGAVWGSGLALVIGGWVIDLVEGLPRIALPFWGDIRSWQLTFLIVGIPGLLVAALMATVKEPPRRGMIPMAGQATNGKLKSLPLRDIMHFLNEEKKTLGPLFFSMSVKALLSFGVTLWSAPFFMRTYGWTASQYGYLKGIVMLVLMPLGMLAGGWLAGWLARKGRDDANMRVVLWATIAMMPTAILFPLMPDPYVALAVSAANSFFAGIGVGPGNAALQIVTPNQMRSQIRALYMFVFNIIGFGLGPLIIALFTDFLFGSEGDLRYSMALLALILAPMAVISTWYGLKPYARSVARAKAWS